MTDPNPFWPLPWAQPPLEEPKERSDQSYPVTDEWGNPVGDATPILNPAAYPPHSPTYPFTEPYGSPYWPPAPSPPPSDWQSWLNETAAGDGEGNFTPATPGDQPIVNGDFWPGYVDEQLPANPYQTPPFFDNQKLPWNQDANRQTWSR